MRVCLLVVGKPRDADFDRLYQRYTSRIRKFGVTWDDAWVPETRAGGRYSDAHVREREAAALLSRVGDDGRGTLVALDPRGEPCTSPALARRVEGWMRPRLTLVVGGPLGLDPGVREKADATWSLSPLTFPHELARLIVAEQIYRALTIARGLPYHK